MDKKKQPVQEDLPETHSNPEAKFNEAEFHAAQKSALDIVAKAAASGDPQQLRDATRLALAVQSIHVNNSSSVSETDKINFNECAYLCNLSSAERRQHGFW